MDKKAWIVVTICMILLGVQFYMNKTQQEEAAAAAEEVAEVAEEAAVEATEEA